VKIEFTCQKCGGNRFIFPLNYSATSVIKCAGCGRDIGTVAEVHQQVMEKLESQAVR
jgi:ribosomal protein S27E